MWPNEHEAPERPAVYTLSADYKHRSPTPTCPGEPCWARHLEEANPAVSDAPAAAQADEACAAGGAGGDLDDQAGGGLRAAVQVGVANPDDRLLSCTGQQSLFRVICGTDLPMCHRRRSILLPLNDT